MAETALWRTIPATHPSLPGHFPGHPVVPGVVLLSEVWEVVAAESGRLVRCCGWPSVKFMAPLLPEVPFQVEVEFTGNGAARFTCRDNTRTLASGTVRFCEAESA